jgi:hypothetical protein
VEADDRWTDDLQQRGGGSAEGQAPGTTAMLEASMPNSR